MSTARPLDSSFSLTRKMAMGAGALGLVGGLGLLFGSAIFGGHTWMALLGVGVAAGGASLLITVACKSNGVFQKFLENIMHPDSSKKSYYEKPDPPQKQVVVKSPPPEAAKKESKEDSQIQRKPEFTEKFGSPHADGDDSDDDYYPDTFEDRKF